MWRENVFDWNTIKYEIIGNVLVVEDNWFWSGQGSAGP